MRKYILLLLFLFHIFIVGGQNKIQFMTPEVSSLIKYINNPVTYDRGAVDISIPLYEIDDAGVKIPITLSYHHKGLRPNEKSSWLGLGWSLTAEPTIARTVNGQVDTDCTYTSADDIRETRNAAYQVRVAKNGIEDPDQYFYTLPTKSGSFFFKRNSSTGVFEAKTIPFEPIKIVYKGDNTFEITDDNGVCYRFGKSLTNSQPYFETANSSIVSWKCTEITSASKKDIVRFDYYSSSNEIISNVTDILQIEDDLREAASGDFGRDYTYDGASSPNNFNNRNLDCTFTIPSVKYSDYGYYNVEFPCISPPETSPRVWSLVKYNKCSNANADVPGASTNSSARRIYTITFKNGRALFYRTSIGHLDRIEIVDANSNLLRKVKFNNIFLNNNTNYPMLSSIEIIDSAGNIVEKYTLDYNNRPNIEYYTTNVNFWGYYTGGITKTNTIHKVDIPIKVFSNHILLDNIDFSVGKADRELPASQDGILKSITTSLGGKTEFVYESDAYLKEEWYRNGSSGFMQYRTYKKNTGGLRIKEIKYFDSITNTTLTRAFKYGKPDISTGIEDGMGIIRKQINANEYMQVQDRVSCYDPLSQQPTGKTRFRTFSSWLFGDISFSGAPIVYDRVTEYMTAVKDGVTTDNGKTIYTYNHASLGSSVVIGTNIDLDTKVDWSRGQLNSKQIFKRENSQYKLIQKTDYLYSTFFKDNIKVGKAYLQTIGFGDNLQNIENVEKLAVKYYSYEIKTGAIKVNAEIDSTFTDNGIIAIKKEYTYGNGEHLYPTSIRTTNSDGSIKNQSMSYPLDNGTLQTSDHLQAKSSLVSNWIVSPVLETKEVVDSESLTTYSSYKIFSNLQIPYFYQTIIKKNDNPSETRFTCYNYDQYGNPVYISKDDTENIVYLWSYQGKYPIAEIRNATYSQINSIIGIESLSARSEPYQSDWTAINGLRTNLSLGDILITTYTYKPLVGLSSMTDPRGLTTYYKYDTSGRLKEIYFIENNIKKIIKQFGYHYQDQ